MIKNISEKLYEKLTAKEWLDLTIAAISRRDEEEFKRLRNSGKQLTYTLSEPEYSGKLEALQIIYKDYLFLAEGYCLEANEIQTAVLGIELSIHYAENCQQLNRELENYQRGVDQQLAVLLAEISKLIEIKTRYEIKLANHISCFKAVHNALLNFCAKVNVNANYLLKWVRLAELCRNVEEYLATDIAANSDVLKRTEKMFLELWEKH